MGGVYEPLGEHMVGTWLQGENVLISVCCGGWEGVESSSSGQCFSVFALVIA